MWQLEGMSRPTPRLQGRGLARLQQGAQVPGGADDPLVGRRLFSIAARLVRSRHDLGGSANRQTRPAARPQRGGGSENDPGDRFPDDWMPCVKLPGQRLAARDFDRQVAEFQVRVAILNGFTAPGTPVAKAAG